MVLVTEVIRKRRGDAGGKTERRNINAAYSKCLKFSFFANEYKHFLKSHGNVCKADCWWKNTVDVCLLYLNNFYLRIALHSWIYLHANSYRYIIVWENIKVNLAVH